MEKSMDSLNDLSAEDFLEKFLDISRTPEFLGIIRDADDWTDNVVKTRKALLAAGLPKSWCQKGSQVEKLARLIHTRIEEIPA